MMATKAPTVTTQASFSVKGLSVSGSGTGAQVAQQINAAFAVLAAPAPPSKKKGKVKKGRPKVMCDRCGAQVTSTHIRIHHSGTPCAAAWPPAQAVPVDFRDIVLASVPPSVHLSTFERAAKDPDFVEAVRMIWRTASQNPKIDRGRKVSVFIETRAGRLDRLAREKATRRERQVRSEYECAIRARDKLDKTIKDLAKRVRYYDRRAEGAALTEADRIVDALERAECAVTETEANDA